MIPECDGCYLCCCCSGREAAGFEQEKKGIYNINILILNYVE